MTSWLHVMRAVIRCIDRRSCAGQRVCHSLVDRFHASGGYEPFCNTTLIRYHDDPKSGSIQQGDCFSHSRKDVEILPGGYVVAFRRVLINHTVPIEENGPAHRASPALMIPRSP